MVLRIRLILAAACVACAALLVSPASALAGGYWPEGTWPVADSIFAPIDVAVAPDGTIYVAESGLSMPAGRVVVRSSDGVFIREFYGDDVPGGGLGDISSIAIGPDGRIWVVDASRARVVVFGTDGGFVKSVGSPGGGDGQFVQPSGIAFDAAASIYVCDPNNFRVVVFDSGGTFSRNIRRAGENANRMEPRAVAIKGDLVFVADTFQDTNPVRRFTTAGVELDNTVAGRYPIGVSQVYTEGGSQFLSRYERLTDLAISSSGELLVSDSEREVVEVVDAVAVGDSLFSTLTSTTVGSPAGIGVAGGSLFVTDRLGRSMRRTPLASLQPWRLFDLARSPAQDSPRGPKSVAVAPDGTQYVADTLNQRVQRITAAGVITMISDPAAPPFLSPSAVALSRDGSILYVADSGADCIRVFGSDGLYRSTIGTAGAGAGQFNDPSAIAVGPAGDIFVADPGNDRLQKFDSTGSFVTTFGTDDVDDPQGIAVDDAGYIYASSAAEGYLRVFDSNLVRIAELGGPGAGIGEFINPHELAISSARGGTLFVADTGNNRIQRLALGGTWLEQVGILGPVTGMLYQPEGVAIGAEDEVHVADTGGDRVVTWVRDDTAPDTAVSPSLNTLYNHPVTIALIATDAVSKVATTYVSVNGEPARSYTGTFTISDSGTTTIEYRSTDVMDNSEASASATFEIDMLPPSGSFIVAEDASVVDTIGITVESSVVDAAQMRFDLGAGFGDWITYSATKVLSLGTEGHKVVKVQYRDLAGNTLSLEKAIAVDLSPPVTAVSVADGAYLPGDTTITLTPTDTYSPIKSTVYTLDEETGTEYFGPFLVSGEGLHTLGVQSTDMLRRVEHGNVITFEIDSRIPAGTMDALPGALYSRSRTVGVQSAFDLATTMRLGTAASPGSWVPYAPAGSVTVPYDGAWNLQGAYRSRSGIEVLRSDSVIVDSTRPTLTALRPTVVRVFMRADGSTRYAVQLRASGSDAVSGVKSYAWNMGAHTMVNTGRPATFSGLGGGTHSYKITAFDRAGNKSVVAGSVRTGAGAKPTVPRGAWRNTPFSVRTTAPRPRTGTKYVLGCYKRQLNGKWMLVKYANARTRLTAKDASLSASPSVGAGKWRFAFMALDGRGGIVTRASSSVSVR